MKKRYTFEKYGGGPLVQGDSDDITDVELRVVEWPDDKIDILKRGPHNEFYSICRGSNVADPEVEISTGKKDSKFQLAVDTLLSMAIETGHAVEQTYLTEVNYIREALPEQSDLFTLYPNACGYLGYTTDNGGFVLYTTEWCLKAIITDNAIVLYKLNVIGSEESKEDDEEEYYYNTNTKLLNITGYRVNNILYGVTYGSDIQLWKYNGGGFIEAEVVSSDYTLYDTLGSYAITNLTLDTAVSITYSGQVIYQITGDTVDYNSLFT